MKAMLAAFAAASVLAATNAQAQDGQLASDIRCVAAISMVAKANPKPEERASLTALSRHYLARIDVRDPTLDVTAALKQVVPQMDDAGWESAFGDCAVRFTAKMQSFEAILKAAQ